MKAKKLIALVLTLLLAFSCIAVIPFTATVASADGETAVTATANTTAIHVGRSTRYEKVPSAIYLNLIKEDYSDNTAATLTAKVKMLNGQKPKVTMFRANSGTKTIQTKASWVKSTSYNAQTGDFTAEITFEDIPGNSNCWYYDYFTTDNGRTSYKRVNAWDGVKGIWGGIAIGNTQFKDNTYVDGDTFEEDFIISDVHLVINSSKASDWVGQDLAPSMDTFKEGQVYSLAGP
ncbi:MAG: hypothetical protein MJ212_06285, partial [Alphaproteobacteria bacterium]|nr:hypothetical protein [Alphaproteobacteria bacterium]